jgi:DNA polymerase III delta prime subunit
MTFDPHLGTTQRAFRESWDRARQRRRENADLFKQMMDQAASEGRDVSPEEVQQKMYELAGNDGWLRGAFPAGKAMQSYIDSTNKRAQATRFQQVLEQVNGEKQKQDAVKAIISQIGPEADQAKVRDALMKSFGEDLGTQLYTAYGPNLQTWQKELVDAEVQRGLSSPEWEQLDDPADVDAAFAGYSKVARDRLKEFLVSKLQREEDERARAAAQRNADLQRDARIQFWNIYNSRKPELLLANGPKPQELVEFASAMSGYTPTGLETQAIIKADENTYQMGMVQRLGLAKEAIVKDPQVVNDIVMGLENSEDTRKVVANRLAALSQLPVDPRDSVVDETIQMAQTSYRQLITEQTSAAKTAAQKSITPKEVADQSKAHIQEGITALQYEDKKLAETAGPLAELISRDYYIPSAEIGKAVATRAAQHLAGGNTNAFNVASIVAGELGLVPQTQAVYQLQDQLAMQMSPSSIVDPGEEYGTWKTRRLNDAKSYVDMALKRAEYVDNSDDRAQLINQIDQIITLMEDEMDRSRSVALWRNGPSGAAIAAEQTSIISALRAEQARLKNFKPKPVTQQPYLGTTATSPEALTAEAQQRTARKQEAQARATEVVTQIKAWGAAVAPLMKGRGAAKNRETIEAKVQELSRVIPGADADLLREYLTDAVYGKLGDETRAAAKLANSIK